MVSTPTINSRLREYPSRICGSFAFCTAQRPDRSRAALYTAQVLYILRAVLPDWIPHRSRTHKVHGFGTDPVPYACHQAGTVDHCTNPQLRHCRNNMIPSFLIACETLNGILRPYSQFPAVYRNMLYDTNGVLPNTAPGPEVHCKSSGLNIFISPPRQTRMEYAGE